MHNFVNQKFNYFNNCRSFIYNWNEKNGMKKILKKTVTVNNNLTKFYLQTTNYKIHFILTKQIIYTTTELGLPLDLPTLFHLLEMKQMHNVKND